MSHSIVQEFLFGTLRGSARGVSLARIIFGSLSLIAIKASAVTHLYALNAVAFSILILFLLVAIAMIAGHRSRVATLATGVILMLIYLDSEFNLLPDAGFPFEARESFGRAINQYFLATVVLLLSLTPCGECYSVDAFRRPFRDNRNFNLSGVQLIRLQVCSMYFWTALQKTNPDYLNGSVFETAWIMRVTGSMNFTHTPSAAFLFSILGIAVIIIELTLCFALSMRRFRIPAIVFGVVFHLSSTLFLPVAAFAFSTIGALILFVPPEYFDRFMDSQRSSAESCVTPSSSTR